MFQGSRQGGGGNDLVFISGLFMSKTGKSMVGYLKKEEFNTFFQLMQEANGKGVDIMLVVSGPGDKGGNLAGRLSAAVARPRQQAAPQGGGFFGAQPAAPAGPFAAPQQAPSQIPAGPFGSGGGQSMQQPAVQQAGVPQMIPPTSSLTTGSPFGQQANQPPKDELESFLEGFDR